MSELNLTREAPNDELADLPENVKLDEGEIVLYKYLCSIRFFLRVEDYCFHLIYMASMRFIFRERNIDENMLGDFCYRFVDGNILRNYELYPRRILRDK